MQSPAHTLLLGGQRSGKSARAETLCADWLARDPAHRAVFVATALPHDAEMRARIARHRADRADRLPGVPTVEAPQALAGAIAAASRPGTLVVVDCLTLWLTQCLMPPQAAPQADLESNGHQASVHARYIAPLLIAIEGATGPLVFVSNEIGLGVVPMAAPVRAFVDALGHLNRDVAARCHRVTLMVAGCALEAKP